MRRKLRRTIARVLVAFLIVGSFQVTPMLARAERDGEAANNVEAESRMNKAFAAKDLSTAWASATGKMVDGKLELTFAAQYDQAKLTLPEPIDLSDCTAVKFTVEDQTVPISLKLWKGESEVVVEYGLSGQREYILTPSSEEIIDAVGIMITEEAPVDAKATFVSVAFTMKGDSSIKLEDNIILNPNFAEEELSMWNIAQGNSTITAETGDREIFENVKSYGKISRDPGSATSQDCFSQDITALVEKGAEYQFEFYAMLSDEYANAPEEQRKVEFCPYITADGTTSYLGTYSSELAGTSSQALVPGEWTKYSGTFTVAYTGELEKVAIRIIEQGTEYGQGECVKGDYYITGVSMRKIIKEEPKIEQHIPALKEAVTAALGEDVIAGVSVVQGELSDETLMQLVTKHFNAVTLGNELKPDAMFGYHNNACPKTQEVTLNGESLTVPVLDHSRADKMLDFILDWNAENPQDALKVRGHVLVWHSQTPEWYFREGYDANRPYVTAEVMNKRLEWYIKTMMEYYVGENSKYKDLFYGWDVVNEAVSDSTGTYRASSENSSWAAVYGDRSNEFIINAFKYANKYAPASLGLYYNDYNECVPKKRDGIVELLKAVKSAEGTRIDGMGMQGHYSMDSPTDAQFKAAARAYAKVVGKVQLTELDFKASTAYDGTDATKEEEYTKQAYRYKGIYDICQELDAEEDMEVSGITIWGVIDKNSWLQTSNSVGGAAGGKQKQCPLLFDDNYKAKPSFWALADADMLEPTIQKVTVVKYVDDSFVQGVKYSFAQGATQATLIPMWSEDGLRVQVTVQDTVVDDRDCITVYVDEANAKAHGAQIQKATVKRSDASPVSGGYQTVVEVPWKEGTVAKVIGFDVAVTNGDEVAVFNDLKQTQDSSSQYYAEATIKFEEAIENGTTVVAEEKEDAGTETDSKPLTISKVIVRQVGFVLDCATTIRDRVEAVKETAEL